MTLTGQGALGGLRVLDCSRFIAGPYCGMLLGDLGADVVIPWRAIHCQWTKVH